eukprot:TRINITY_DN468_c0_g1_i4.p1 TRINITY_DN468_c0_g1~~TRINITY_DN468_c0_g1_i4.p1  ORF type:complete len:555 (+),score=177.28 TRINITY_DN468_c0_g1_i4:803-2467(+)
MSMPQEATDHFSDSDSSSDEDYLAVMQNNTRQNDDDSDGFASDSSDEFNYDTTTTNNNLGSTARTSTFNATTGSRAGGLGATSGTTGLANTTRSQMVENEMYDEAVSLEGSDDEQEEANHGMVHESQPERNFGDSSGTNSMSNTNYSMPREAEWRGGGDSPPKSPPQSDGEDSSGTNSMSNTNYSMPREAEWRGGGDSPPKSPPQSDGEDSYGDTSEEESSSEEEGEAQSLMGHGPQESQPLSATMHMQNTAAGGPKESPQNPEDAWSDESSSDESEDEEEDDEEEEHTQGGGVNAGGDGQGFSGQNVSVGGSGGWHAGYNPDDYQNLDVAHEIKELFQYITRYKPQTVEIETKLKPFIPDYIPAVGDIDAFIKIPRPDGQDDALGLTVLDEPAAIQSDPAVLQLKLRQISKDTVEGPVSVPSLQRADKSPHLIEKWTQDISKLHRVTPKANVHYTKNMPSLDDLMQIWPPEFEELLNSGVKLPGADLDMELDAFAKTACALVDIPVYNKLIESMHLFFTLYSEFKANQLFKQQQEQEQMAMFAEAEELASNSQ